MTLKNLGEFAEKLKAAGLPIIKIYEKDEVTDAGIEFIDRVSIQICQDGAIKICIWNEGETAMEFHDFTGQSLFKLVDAVKEKIGGEE